MVVLFKYTVVGGVVIPNYIKVVTALNGLLGYSFYRYSHDMKSKYGVELPKRLTSSVTGTMTLVAAYAAYDVYFLSKCLARMRAVDKTDFAKMRARMPQSVLNLPVSTGSLILLAGAVAMSMGTDYRLVTFQEEFKKKRAMKEKENSANPSV